MKNTKLKLFKSSLVFLLYIIYVQLCTSQQVEVLGELKVTNMTVNDEEDDLVVRNPDGTLGTRSASSLPPPPPPIDSTRNLASDFELAKHLCQCQQLPPFMIKKLLESGYTIEDLVSSGVPINDVYDAQRGGLMIDSRDKQAYKTVVIGNQIWMAENLNYGNNIIGSASQTDNDIIEKYCYGDDANNCSIYGGLYQWDEMMQYSTSAGIQGICPTGWHLPTDQEVQILELELGMTQAQASSGGNRGADQGSKLSGKDYLWLDGSLDQNGAFGSSGFDAIPGGQRYYTSGTFQTQGSGMHLWTSSESSGGTLGVHRSLERTNANIYRGDRPKSFGHSVRCVQD